MEVLLSALGEGESKYFTLRQGKSERIKVEKGEWYKIGAAIQNPEEVAIAAEIIVEDADIR